MAYQKGDVVLVPFPFTDLSATKVRPAVLLSPSAYETATGSVTIAMITSKAHTTPYDYQLAHWKKANLIKPSWVRCKVVTIDPSLIVHTIGRLNASDLHEVEVRLRLSFGL